jgi:hypothetical protein
VPALGIAGLSLSLASIDWRSDDEFTVDLTASWTLPWRRGNLGRQLVDVLRLRQGKCRTTSARRESRSVGLRRMPRMPLGWLSMRLERLRRLRRLLLVLGSLSGLLDPTLVG